MVKKKDDEGGGAPKRRKSGTAAGRVPKIRKVGGGVAYGEHASDGHNSTRTEALQQRAEVDYVTVQASFGGRLLRRAPEAIREYVRDEIDRFVLYVSERLVIFSLVLNEAVRGVMNNGGAPIDFSANKMQQLIAGNGDPRVQAVWARWDADLPDSCKSRNAPVGVSQVLKHAANGYAVNHAVSMLKNFPGRLARFIRGYIRLHAPSLLEEKGMWYQVFCDTVYKPRAWNGPFSRDASDLVDMLRDRLQWPEGTDLGAPPGIEGNAHHKAILVRVNTACSFQLLRLYLEFDVPKAFAMVPMSNVKRHHINLDTTTIVPIIKRAVKEFGNVSPKWMRKLARMAEPDSRVHQWSRDGGVGATLDEVLGSLELMEDPEFAAEVRSEYSEALAANQKKLDYAWRRFFSLEGLRNRQRYTFSGLTTNGVAASIKFTRPKTTPRSPEDEAIQKHQALVLENRVDVFIDPGRSNMVTALRVEPDGTETWMKLSRSGYYHSFRGGRCQLKSLNGLLRDVDAAFAQPGVSYKSTPAAHDAYIRTYIQHYVRLWTIRGGKRYARTIFFVTMCKRRCLDRFFASFVVPDQPRPHVWYGNGTFGTHSSGADGLAVPTKYVLKACKRMHITFLVDEFMTSQMHSRCEERMDKVRTRRFIGPEVRWGASKRDVRGVHWCVGCKMFVDRDRDACRSIGHAALSMERPLYLQRDVPRRDRITREILPPRRFRYL